MSRLPIRWRLTIAFAVATGAVLLAAFWFVHARLRADFDDSIAATLRARQGAAVDLLQSTGSLTDFPLEDPEESFVTLVGDAGQVVDGVGLARDPLAAGQIGAALAGERIVTRSVAGIDGPARMLVGPLAGQPGQVLVVGQSLANRDEALRDLVVSFALAAPLAIVLASLAGYAMARVAFAPVEEMRASAQRLSITGGGRRLPVPAAHDEIRRLAITLNEMLVRIEGAFEHEQRFVADASHELRTPIAAIRLDLEAALAAFDGSPAARESVRAALDECDSLAQLADDLLVIARSGPDGLVVTTERVAVPALLQGVASRFADRAAQHGRRIDTIADDVTADLDPVRFRQALTNLIDNALRHGAGPIGLRARQRADLVEIDVTDEGEGFGDDIAGRAFERFTRGNASRSAPGAGLGLAIVDTIVRAHRGTTAVLPGPPTTVRITLPAPTA